MKKGWKPFSPKNKLAQDSEGYEEKQKARIRVQQNKEKVYQ
jgi:hypothetical protein